MAELRSFIFIDRLQPQTMSYLGSWIRGALPRADVAAQIIEVAPGLDIEGITDVALKHADIQAGMLVVERQFGYLEFHGETGAVKAAADAALAELGQEADAAVRPDDPGRQDHLQHRSTARIPDQPQQDRFDGAGR